MIRRLRWMLLICCLSVSAVPAQESQQQPDNQVTIHAANADLVARAHEITFYFNPKEIPVDKAVPWKHHSNSEGDLPDLEFTSGKPATLSVELFFDPYENSPSPGGFAAILGGLVGQVAPLLVTWGGRLWTGSLLRADPRFSRLDAQGNPGRAIVMTYWTDLTLVEPHVELPFTVDIPGCPEAATDVREISIDPVTMESPPPGRPRRARFTLAMRQGIPAELLRWQEEPGIRKNITVTIFNSRRTPVRSYTLDAGGPIGLTVHHPGSPIPHVELELSYDRVELTPLPGDEPPAAAPAQAALLPQVELPSPFFGVEGKLTSLAADGGIAFFRSCSGLKMDTEIVDYQEGGIHDTTKRLTGRAPFPNLTLVGTPEFPRPAIIGWANAAFNGHGIPAQVTLTPLYLFHGQPRPTRSLVTGPTLPDRYVFPKLSALRSDGDVTEKFSLPPVFAVLQGQ
jgi:hypothetical protein